MSSSLALRYEGVWSGCGLVVRSYFIDTTLSQVGLAELEDAFIDAFKSLIMFKIIDLVHVDIYTTLHRKCTVVLLGAGEDALLTLCLKT